MDAEAAKDQAVATQSATSDKKLEYWLQIAPVMLHSIDEDGKFVAVTDYWLSRLGYRREDVIGKQSTDFLTPQSREDAIKLILPRLFRLGYIENVEYQFVCKNGDVLDVMVSAVMDESNLEGRRETISVMTDVTDRKRIELRLAESEELYRGLIENQTELVSMARPSGELIFVNEAYSRVYSETPETMAGRNLFDFIPPEIRAFVTDHFERVCQTKQMLKSENQVETPDGNRRWIAWTNRALVDREGKVIAIHSVGRDIEERVQAENRIRDSEARYRLLAENSTDIVFQLDRTLARQYVSPSSVDLLGYEPEELMGNRPASTAHPDDTPRLVATLNAILSGGNDKDTIIYRIGHRDGRWIWLEGNAKAIRDPKTHEVTGLIGSLRDISARKLVEDQLAAANRQLSDLALMDWLTQLPNRRSFNIDIDREFRRARREQQPLSVLMLDVDHFKAFNDRFGHLAGDDCLRLVAETIGFALRRPGDIAARYGGEEFVIILSNTDVVGAGEVAANLQKALAERAILHPASKFGFVTLSCGVATMASDDANMTLFDLIKRADAALYRAKAEGRNTICFADD